QVCLAQDRPERVAVAFRVPGRIATPVRSRILDDDLRRRIRTAMQKLVRRLLIPGEAALASLELEQKVVLASRPEGAELRASDRAVLETEEERGVILERAPRNERLELGEHLSEPSTRNVLGEIEPVSAEIGCHVRRTRAGRLDTPAAGDQERVVADVP